MYDIIFLYSYKILKWSIIFIHHRPPMDESRLHLTHVWFYSEEERGKQKKKKKTKLNRDMDDIDGESLFRLQLK